jgi:hypothetical protein
MITFVLAAAMLVAALCVAAALDGATTEAPPGVVAHVLAARLLATGQTVPVAWDVRLSTDRGRTRCKDRPACQQRLGQVNLATSGGRFNSIASAASSPATLRAICIMQGVLPVRDRAMR